MDRLDVFRCICTYAPVAAHNAWLIAYQSLQHHRSPWNLVTGPLHAAVATLFELGWDPLGPCEWVDASGSTWELSDLQGKPTRANCGPVLTAIAQSAEQLLWKQAQKHRLGSDLHGVPDVSICKRLHDDYVRDSLYAHAGMLVKVISGGLWHRARWHDEYQRALLRHPSPGDIEGVAELEHMFSSACPLCGHHTCDEKHVAYCCPFVNQHESVIALDDSSLVNNAIQAECSPVSFWLRGLNCRLYDGIASPSIDPVISVFPAEPWPPGKYYADGSGGPQSSNPKLRRAAGAAAKIESTFNTSGDFDPVASHLLTTSTPGLQTINRAELFILVATLQQISPVHGEWTELVSDSLYCTLTYNEWGFAKAIHGPKSDLWQLFFDEVQRHGYRVRLRKVEAHCKLSDAQCGAISFADLVGNGFADALAGHAAKQQALHPDVISSFAVAKNHTIKVLKRLVVTNICFLELLKALKP